MEFQHIDEQLNVDIMSIRSLFHRHAMERTTALHLENQLRFMFMQENGRCYRLNRIYKIQFRLPIINESSSVKINRISIVRRY